MKRKQISALLLAIAVCGSFFNMPAEIVKAETNEDLIISEYIEGSGNNKAIEIFNGSGKSIDLSGYSVELYSNGKSTAGSTLNLQGTLEHNSTYVIAYGQANSDILAKANTTSNVANFNGDDALVLKNGENVIDSFGQVGFDPGTEWKNNDVSTKDMTLIRKETVLNGDKDPSDEFDPSIEWVALPTDDISNLGSHTIAIEEDNVEGLVSIEAARSLELGSEVIVKGVVTFKESSGQSYNYTIQDASGAIALRGGDGLEVCDEVVIKGKTSDYNGLMQVNGFEIIEKRDKKDLPESKVITIADVENNGGENYESQRVRIENLTLGTISPDGTTVLTDSEGKTINLYKCGQLTEVKAGDTVNLCGVLSQFSKTGEGGYQLRISNSTDIEKVGGGSEPENPDPGVDTVGPNVTNVTPANSENIGENRTPEISATFEDESGVDMDTVKLTFDGTDVTTDLVKEENTIKYQVNQSLEDGKHKVILEVSDTLGNKTTKEWSFKVGTEEYNLYFGQLHSHTNISDGQGSINEAYEYAKNTAGVDFMAVTDHSNWFDNDTSANLSDGSASSEWTGALATADQYNQDGDFVAMYGYEMTWSGSTGGYGHINTFNTPGFETRSNKKMDLENYYKTLTTEEESLSQLNHPGKTFGDFSDFSNYNTATDEVVTLIEVGNGEGAVRGSGYFPSYEYYIRALDKGWHVAPSNNQDNHKGKWGNANTARTVVEATDLTRESVYDAIRERRTYATEDENLRISYKVNGSTMGSILDKTDTLDFSISVEDMDNGDNIKKISIIGDGGKVVTSIDNINDNTKEWNFTLDANASSYYFVRVDQSDKDIAVTSPIWVGERENVGISTVDCDTEVITEGEEFNIETSIYNNEATDLNDVKVEYYVNESTEPIVNTIDKVSAAGTYVDKLTYKFDKAGDYKVEVKVTGTVNGVLREFKGSTEVKVVKADGISKVVIDGSHQNQYVTGDYADKITTLTGLMAQNSIKAIVNKEPITDKTLEGASLLILSDPQSLAVSSSGLTPQKYSQDELDAIARFVESGGNIAITSKADYKDAAGEYGNATQGNSVLQAIGAQIRFNDDQATDDVENGGQSYRLYLDDYNTESSWLNGIDTTKKYSFYSGSTLIMPTDCSNIDVLVKGHETTYGNDADNSGDNVDIGKGDVIGLAVETLPSGSKVMISGATFFSNFEMDGLDYSNYQITEKMLNTLAASPEVAVSNIVDVRVDADNDNNPDRFGERVVVEGYVTAASNASAKGNSFFDVIYVQDETGGLTVFGVSSTEVKLGQKVRVTGKVSSYLGDAQVALDNEELDLQIIDENINLVAPTELTTRNSMLEEKEGLLVKVAGKVTRIEGQNIFVDDGTGEARVYTEGYIGSSTNPGVADEWKERVKVGDNISAIGLASEDTEGHRLRVRDSAEIVIVEDGGEGTTNKSPVINVEDKTIKQGEAFDPLAGVTASDEEDGDLTQYLLITENTVNPLKLGKYKVSYAILDNDGNRVDKTIVVKVVDENGQVSNTPPVITAVDKTITVGDNFNPLEDVIASDAEDGDLTHYILVAENTVDTKKTGKYRVTYAILDTDGNRVDKTIEVKVLGTDGQLPNNKPTIEAHDKTIKVGEIFDPLAGVKASDDEDGDLTHYLLVVENLVDISKVGKYKVIYAILDTDGNRIDKTITITVE